MGYGPEAPEPDLCEGDLVGVVWLREGFRLIITRWPELKSVFDVGNT